MWHLVDSANCIWNIRAPLCFKEGRQCHLSENWHNIFLFSTRHAWHSLQQVGSLNLLQFDFLQKNSLLLSSANRPLKPATMMLWLMCEVTMTSVLLWKFLFLELQHVLILCYIFSDTINYFGTGILGHGQYHVTYIDSNAKSFCAQHRDSTAIVVGNEMTMDLCIDNTVTPSKH